MSKIILAQIDTQIGKIKQNTEKIKAKILEAKSVGADLIIFPEFSLVGYPFKDLYKRHKSLLKIQENSLKEIINLSRDITIVMDTLNADYKSIPIILSNGKFIKEVLLDNEPYKVISGEYDVSQEKQDVNIIHVSASSSRNGKEYIRNNYISQIAKNNKINYIYVNSVGYNDNLVFDGASRIYNKNGKITALAKNFEEDFLITENLTGRIEILPANSDKMLSEAFSMNYEDDLERLYKQLICGIKGYFYKNGFTKAVLGLSGGLDSTICAVLLADALGKDNVVGVSMPTRISSQGSKDDAKNLANNLGIEYIQAPISNETDVFTAELKEIFSKIHKEKYNVSTTFENIQARTRATILWSIANEYKGMLPIATSDKSEGYIGYATTNGDMSGGFAPISDVTKTKLFSLGRYINRIKGEIIPENILDKPPGAELKFDNDKGRTITAEEDNMPYPFLDEIIWNIEHFGLDSDELFAKEFFYEKQHNISYEQKKEWLNKFYNKYEKAVFKWHLMPPGIITEPNTISQSEYYHPIV